MDKKKIMTCICMRLFCAFSLFATIFNILHYCDTGGREFVLQEKLK